MKISQAPQQEPSLKAVRQHQTELDNRALKVIAMCNRAIIRADCQENLLTEVCKIAVETGGYQMAWAGFVNYASSSKSIYPVAFAGHDGGYLDSINIRWDDSVYGGGPSGQSIRSGEPVVVQDIQTDPTLTPWRNNALGCGFRSTIALPIKKTDANLVLGVLRIYSSKANTFGSDEVELLTELAYDISFGLINKRATERLRVVEESLRASEDNLRKIAFYDALTGLPNRSLYLDRLGQVLAVSARGNKAATVMFMDLDNFKDINDTKGHAAGDQALIEVADRIQHVLRLSDTAARIGGDEFAFVFSDTDRKKAKLIAEKILLCLQEPVKIGMTTFNVGASIGIATFPEDGHLSDLLISKADIAMYKAKSSGGGFRFFYTEMSSTVKREVELAHGLKQAIPENELHVFYQPQVHLGSGELIGVEALVRWKKNGDFYSSPDEFIPIAERRGLIADIDTWVFTEVCKQIQVWLGQGRCCPKVAVNISAQHLGQHNFIDKVIAISDSFNVSPQMIQFEITETAIATDYEAVANTLTKLKESGFSVALDDFGVGRSSLSLLSKLSVNTLKIDKSFVADILVNSLSLALIESILSAAHVFGLTVVAEGIEEESQARALTCLGCEVGQGYYYGVPSPDVSVFEGRCHCCE